MSNSILILQIILSTINNPINNECIDFELNTVHFMGNRSFQKTNQNNPSTVYSSPETLVLQILPKLEGYSMQIHGKLAQRTLAIIFFPDSKHGQSIKCPLTYFQESCSLPEKWILNDDSQKIHLNDIDKLQRVIITKKIEERENILPISNNYAARLLDYFRLDICHNTDSFIGFDCLDFVSLLADVKHCPENPEFEYFEQEPSMGDIIVLANNRKLPNSIKHWALYLGEDLYLSKFGRSGEGSQSFVDIMDLKGMMYLYDCEFLYLARPKVHAKPWNSF